MAVARVTKQEKQYVVEYMDGKVERITVPEGSKITYGRLTPGSNSARFGPQDGTGPYAIRVYEGGEGIQLGVFPNVKKFRDVTTIKVERLSSDDHGEARWDEDNGMMAFVDAAQDALGGKNKSGNMWECDFCSSLNHRTSIICSCGAEKP